MSRGVGKFGGQVLDSINCLYTSSLQILCRSLANVLLRIRDNHRRYVY